MTRTRDRLAGRTEETCEPGQALHWTCGRKWIVEQDSCLSLSTVDTDAHAHICKNTHTHTTKVLGYHLWVLNQLAGAQLASSSDKMPNMLPNGLDQMNEICRGVVLFNISGFCFFPTLVNFYLFFISVLIHLRLLLLFALLASFCSPEKQLFPVSWSEIWPVYPRVYPTATFFMNSFSFNSR